MNLIVRIFVVLAMSVLIGEESYAIAGEETPDLRIQCEEAGFVMGGEKSQEQELKKPSHEEQVAFVKAHPECPPYDWWEVMQGIVRRPLSVMVEHHIFEGMYLRFPKETHFPTPQIGAFCSMCEDAQKALNTLNQIDHESCGFPSSPNELAPDCSHCQRKRK